MPRGAVAREVSRLQKYDSRRFRSEDRSMNSKKWLSIFSTEAEDTALTVGTIFLRDTNEASQWMKLSWDTDQMSE